MGMHDASVPPRNRQSYTPTSEGVTTPSTPLCLWVGGFTSRGLHTAHADNPMAGSEQLTSLPAPTLDADVLATCQKIAAKVAKVDRVEGSLTQLGLGSMEGLHLCTELENAYGADSA